MELPHLRHDFDQGVAGVVDVVDQEDVPVGNVGHQRGVDEKLSARGRRTAVATGLDHTDTQRQFELADQVGQEDKTAGQDADNRHWSTCIPLRDLSRHSGYTLTELLLAEQDFHFLHSHPSGLSNLDFRAEPNALASGKNPRLAPSAHSAAQFLTVTKHYTRIPATQAVMKQARVPPIMALRPSLAKSDRRSGAIPPIPPIWIPIELKLAKPEIA